MHKIVPTARELIQQFPLSSMQSSFISQSRQTIKNILDGLDTRLLFIIGPCSIHDIESTLEYAKKFRALADSVEDQFFMVMRAYLEKPRTHKGWKGFIFDPYLNNSHEIGAGLALSRSLLVTLTEMGIPLGCELLELTTHPYIGDLLSWGCIGARTTTSQPHRLLASSLPMPIGFKNTTDGNIDNPINAIMTANSPHTFLGLDLNGRLSKIQSCGNSYCHIVLRGQDQRPNYDPDSIDFALKKMNQSEIRNRMIIDCSHGNCNKIALNQISAFESVVKQISQGNHRIAGAMLESHLFAGSQTIPEDPSVLDFGVSVTDPCLDWETTETLIKNAYSSISMISTQV